MMAFMSAASSRLSFGRTASVGYDHVRFTAPVFIGDTIYAETEVVDVRESNSRPQWGVVTFEHRGKNQRGEIVVRCRRAAMMLRKPASTVRIRAPMIVPE